MTSLLMSLWNLNLPGINSFQIAWIKDRYETN
jgi:hypothetical protein